MEKQTAVEFLHSEYKKIFGDTQVTFSQILKITDALEQAKKMESQKDAKYNEILETLEIVSKKLNGNGFPSLQNQIEKVIKDVKFNNK
jgi:molecular chaperone GrpE (heat shock protein)